MRLLGAALILFALAGCGAGAAGNPAALNAEPRSAWKDWDVFAKRFVQADGRVIDLTFDQKSTSEGQSYGLFFALVANDRARFQTILDWTNNNLAWRQLGKRLPAWVWGRRDDGSWGINDQNPASDADLWIAYSLLEAARLWDEPQYAVTARRLLDEIKKQEIVDAGDAGPILLPGPMGFVLEGERYRVDPSYLPPFMFRYFEGVDPEGPWMEILQAHLRMVEEPYRKGIAPDLFVVDSAGRVSRDPDRPFHGYDAIRVYTWAAMSGADGAELMSMLKGYTELLRAHGNPPEKIEPATAEILKKDFSPMGFSGAILPFLSVLGETQMLEQQRARLRTRFSKPTNYYDECLILFGQGWVDGLYRFDQDGRLLPRWNAAKPVVTKIAETTRDAGQSGSAPAG